MHGLIDFAGRDTISNYVPSSLVASLKKGVTNRATYYTHIEHFLKCCSTGFERHVFLECLSTNNANQNGL
jgi:hypothetical protein